MQNDPFSCRVGHILPFERATLLEQSRLAGTLVPLLMFQLQKNPPASAKQVSTTSLAGFITRPQAGSNWRRENIKSSMCAEQSI